MDGNHQGTPAEGGISFERERLKLEGERLALEKERLDAKAEELEALQASLGTPEERELALTPGIVAVIAVVALLLGVLVGGAIGFDSGYRKNPTPRKVLVSRSFLSLMNRVNGRAIVDYEEPGAPDWFPEQRTVFPETLPLVR